jgi:hypothetical protein
MVLFNLVCGEAFGHFLFQSLLASNTGGWSDKGRRFASHWGGLRFEVGDHGDGDIPSGVCRTDWIA